MGLKSLILRLLGIKREDVYEKEEEMLKRLKRLNDLREEIYRAFENNIKKRLPTDEEESEKGKAYIVPKRNKRHPAMLGGKS